MSQDPTLLKFQYRDGTNLNARIALHARFSTAGRDFHDWLFDHIVLPAEAHLLELGCGTGQMWSTVEQRVPADWQLTLTDLSSGMLAATRTKFAHIEAATRSGAFSASSGALRHTHYVQSDAQAIPFPDNHFDGVIANHMLYHVPDLPRALAEVQRVLKPGGRLHAATNGESHLHELAQLAFESGVEAAAVWSLQQAMSFRLENGVELLSPYFATVECVDFDDSLAVTEVEPLVAYVLSMNANMGRIDAEREGRLREVASRRIARDGVIRIAKSAGLFIAEKA
jgi:SAM-dependent methyltransferase